MRKLQSVVVVEKGRGGEWSDDDISVHIGRNVCLCQHGCSNSLQGLFTAGIKKKIKC